MARIFTSWARLESLDPLANFELSSVLEQGAEDNFAAGHISQQNANCMIFVPKPKISVIRRQRHRMHWSTIHHITPIWYLVPPSSTATQELVYWILLKQCTYKRMSRTPPSCSITVSGEFLAHGIFKNLEDAVTHLWKFAVGVMLTHHRSLPSCWFANRSLCFPRNSDQHILKRRTFKICDVRSGTPPHSSRTFRPSLLSFESQWLYFRPPLSQRASDQAIEHANTGSGSPVGNWYNVLCRCMYDTPRGIFTFSNYFPKLWIWMLLRYTR